MNLHAVPQSNWDSWMPNVPRWTMAEWREHGQDARLHGRLTTLWRHPDTKMVLAVWRGDSAQYVIFPYELQERNDNEFIATKERIERGTYSWGIWESHTMERMHDRLEHR